VHCVQDASDLAQDTYMRLLRQCPEELQEPRAFLATVARSVLIDHCRRMSLERAYLETWPRCQSPYVLRPKSGPLCCRHWSR
jgi:RNA polymerase sigma-70 factor (ECF subfamily)